MMPSEIEELLRELRLDLTAIAAERDKIQAESKLKEQLDGAKIELEQAQREARLREAVQSLSDALTKQHQWHAAQTDPDPEYGFIPADEYADSSLYEATVKALHNGALALGSEDYVSMMAVYRAALNGEIIT